MPTSTPRSDAVAAYLRRVGLPGDLTPDLPSLVRLHRAHLAALPYESVSTMLGRPPSVAPADCLARVGEVGRAGYCFHQNGALELVLRDLGYAVSRRHGHVYTDPADRLGDELNHLVLVVDGLATPEHPDGRWWVDAGLGDCFRDPVAVRVGPFEQDGFGYAITEVRPDGWSFTADEAGSFVGVEVSSRPIDQAAVAAAHAHLSTPPGTFTRLTVVQRRTATAADTVRGCVWTRVTPAGVTTTVLTSYDAWRAAVVDELGLSLEGLDEAELRTLYDAQWAKHQAWDAAGRP